MSTNDLVNGVTSNLKQDGRLGRFRAELRSVVMSILDKNSNESTLPTVPEQTKIINELIREYLVWNGYIYSEQVLRTETGQSEPVSREELTIELDVADDECSYKVPLLYYVVSAFQNRDLN